MNSIQYSQLGSLAHEFRQYCPELGAHVDPEHGGDGPGQQGTKHGHVPQVKQVAEHPNGQGGDDVFLLDPQIC